MALTKEESQAAAKLLKSLEERNGRTYSIKDLDALSRVCEGFGDLEDAARYRLMAQYKRELEAFAEELMYNMLANVPPEMIEQCGQKKPSANRSVPPPRLSPSRKGGFRWSFFFNALAMVLFVAFTAGYEGMRIGVLSDDRATVLRMEEGACKVESLLMRSASGEQTREIWRAQARSGDRSARRGLGLLRLCGRSGVEVPTDEVIMSRLWSLFGFALYFGMGVFAYYVVRPTWNVLRSRRLGRIASVVALVLTLFGFYVPGLVVFHLARQWYPEVSSCMTSLVSGWL